VPASLGKKWFAPPEAVSDWWVVNVGDEEHLARLDLAYLRLRDARAWDGLHTLSARVRANGGAWRTIERALTLAESRWLDDGGGSIEVTVSKVGDIQFSVVQHEQRDGA